MQRFNACKLLALCALTAALGVMASCDTSADPADGGDSATTQSDDPKAAIRAFKDKYAGDRYAKEDRPIHALAQSGADYVNSMRGSYACTSCHTIGPGSGNITGPKLTDVADRYLKVFGDDATRTRIWLHNKISNVNEFPGMNTAKYSKGLMPVMHESYQPMEIEAIVEYLMSLAK